MSSAGTDLNVGLASDDNGLVFEDGTTGTEDFRVLGVNASSVAEQLGILIDGAYTMRQVMRNDDAAAIARDTAELVLDRHIPR